LDPSAERSSPRAPADRLARTGSWQPEPRRAREAQGARDALGHEVDTASHPGVRPLAPAARCDSAWGSTSGTSPPPVGPIGPNTLIEIQRHEKVEFWSAEFTLPPASDVLRSQALAVYIARATGGRFVIRVEGRAVWVGVRPSYSLLGTNVHVVTTTNSFPATRNVGPSPAIVSNPSLVQELLALVNSIPVFEDKGAEFSCPAEKPRATSEGSFVLTFAEQPSTAPLATLEGQPYACGESFLPIISVPGHPPLELSVEPALVRMINRIAGLHLPQG
jgi:hypothetical protein